MAIPLGLGLGIGGALLGALAGSQGNQATQTYSRQLLPQTDLEKQAGKSVSSSLSGFQEMVDFGPGQAEVKAGLASQQELAQLLQQMMQSGGLPNQQQLGFANQFTRDIFAPEQTALNQRFQDSLTTANRQAARMGRGGNDPILMNKLMQEQTRQQQMLDSQMTGYRSQFAQALPMQQLDLAKQFAGVQTGLASQAMRNREALFNLGNQLKSSEQNFRTGNATTTQSTSSGGGFMGGLQGALMGAGAGMQAASLVGSFGSPAATPTRAMAGMPNMLNNVV